ncbi:MAG: hypothetical protein HOH38_12845 [Nitrospinaceae bacterium]|jgi:hypothetical protein|nr:hypothetical protein [Nitrospinaceae bacterium]
MTQNLFKTEWERLERDVPQPRYLRNVHVDSFESFQQSVLNPEPQFVKSVVDSLYSGDVFILKNAFNPEFMVQLVNTMYEHGEQSESSFHKMLDGCPDFHRKITPELAKNYALRQIKHSYYFFNWNNDPFNLFSTINKRWGIFKVLGGFCFNEYEDKSPSTGIVDRLQIAQYPSGVGELELHSDPYLYQKVAISGIMTKRGEHFNTGGAYVLNAKNQKIDLEDQFDIGDVYIVYPTVLHGVETIDKDQAVDWNSIRGRWFMGLYSNASDIYKNRHTCYGVESTGQSS